MQQEFIILSEPAMNCHTLAERISEHIKADYIIQGTMLIVSNTFYQPMILKKVFATNTFIQDFMKFAILFDEEKEKKKV